MGAAPSTAPAITHPPDGTEEPARKRLCTGPRQELRLDLARDRHGADGWLRLELRDGAVLRGSAFVLGAGCFEVALPGSAGGSAAEAYRAIETDANTLRVCADLSAILAPGLRLELAPRADERDQELAALRFETSRLASRVEALASALASASVPRQLTIEAAELARWGHSGAATVRRLGSLCMLEGHVVFDKDRLRFEDATALPLETKRGQTRIEAWCTLLQLPADWRPAQAVTYSFPSGTFFPFMFEINYRPSFISQNKLEVGVDGSVCLCVHYTILDGWPQAPNGNCLQPRHTTVDKFQGFAVPQGLDLGVLKWSVAALGLHSPSDDAGSDDEASGLQE